MELNENRKKYGRIRNQLVTWFLLLGIIPLLVVSGISYHAAKKGLTDGATQQLRLTSLDKIRFIQNWFDYRWMDLLKQSEDEGNALFLETLVDSLKHSGQDAGEFIQGYEWALLTSAFQQPLVNTWLEYDYIYDLFLIDEKGNILYTVVREDDLGTNLYSGKYSHTLFSKAVNHTLKTGESYFSDYEYYSPSDNLLSAFLTAPLLNGVGEVIGVFAVQLRLDRINALLKHDIKDNLVHYLVGEDGLLRSSIGGESEVLRRKINTQAFNLWSIEMIEAQKGGLHDSDHKVMSYQGPDGNDVIGVFQTVRIKNATWVLISEVDTDDAFASVIWLGKFVIGLLIITVIVIIVFSIKLSKSISKPISELVDASEHLILGDFSRTVSINAENELGKLAEVFNRMVIARQRHEEAIRAQARDTQIALDQLEEQRFALAHHAILAITDIKGAITYVNSKFEEISGYSEEELIGQNHRILNSGYHSTDFFREMYLAISSGEIWNGEICNRAKDGHLYWVYTTIAPFKNEQGKIDRYIAIRTDISGQKQAQQDLLEAKEAAEMAAKAKSEFLASMSHEIRTPMNGVLGMLGLLMRGKLSPDQQHQARLALNSAESLLVLINDILDFSKIEAGRLEIEVLEFDLVSMLGDFSETMAQKAQLKGIEFMLDVSGVSETMVRGDPGRIRQILTNLVSNAVKFTQQGEIIIKVALIEKNDGSLCLQCSVRDTGIGIPEQKLEHIFDSFTQVDASTTRKFGGTGLGLAIARQLCLMMGGDISVESELDEGSCFSFHIQMEKSNQSKLLLPNVDITDVEILVVDDNATNREVLKRQLQIWGAKVTEAIDGHDALAKLKERHSNDALPFFKVALVDYQMPGMSGADLGNAIRADQRYDDLALIMMTSISNRGDAKMFAHIGFAGYFPKPATTSDLFNALAVILTGGEVLESAQPLVTRHYLQSLESDDVETKPISNMWPRNVRILLVEDNFINQTVAMGILEEFGLNCETAENGLEALELLKKAENAYPYSLILMDCQMPEMDGYETTQAIRRGDGGEENRDIIIIAMTANAMIGDKEKCLSAGMNDYMSKPIASEEVNEKLTQWLLGEEPKPAKMTMEHKEDCENVDVWDQAELMKRVNGKKERAAMLIDMFLSELPEYQHKFARHQQGTDLLQLAEVAHALKGISGNLGAKKLMSISSKIEKEAKANNSDGVMALLQSVPASIEELVNQLNDFKQG